MIYTCSPATVLTPADDENHIDKLQFKVPFVCGARNLGEALRRIAEGAAMIRTKGEAGTGVYGGGREGGWVGGRVGGRPEQVCMEGGREGGGREGGRNRCVWRREGGWNERKMEFLNIN